MLYGLWLNTTVWSGWAGAPVASMTVTWVMASGRDSPCPREDSDNRSSITSGRLMAASRVQDSGSVGDYRRCPYSVKKQTADACLRLGPTGSCRKLRV